MQQRGGDLWSRKKVKKKNNKNNQVEILKDIKGANSTQRRREKREKRGGGKRLSCLQKLVKGEGGGGRRSLTTPVGGVKGTIYSKTWRRKEERNRD